MIARARAAESIFRRGAKGLEALAPPGEGGTHVHYQPSRAAGLGCVTSRPKPTVSFFELLAYQLGCNVTTAKELWEKGLLK